MRKFGLIGFPLGHSFSQKYFTEKFQKEGIGDAEYFAFPIENISELPNLIVNHLQLQGLNVTIPYKESVIPFLSDYNEIVRETGACNCISIRDNKLIGYNTDVIGFELSLQKKLQPHHNKALILGEGGAAKAVAYVLKKLSIDYLIVSRRDELSAGKINYNEITDELISEHLLIVNCTPLGMHPHIDKFPSLPYKLIGAKHYLFDLIYNPAKTKFLEFGEQQGATIENGYEMLVLQAEESWKIWNL